MRHEDDCQKYKGTPHDFIGFDEIADLWRASSVIITWHARAIWCSAAVSLLLVSLRRP